MQRYIIWTVFGLVALIANCTHAQDYWQDPNTGQLYQVVPQQQQTCRPGDACYKKQVVMDAVRRLKEQPVQPTQTYQTVPQPYVTTVPNVPIDLHGQSVVINNVQDVAMQQQPGQVCPSCGQVHSHISTNLQPTYQRGTTGSAGFALLNQQRANRGLGPLVADQSLMAGALAKATQAARLRNKGHLGGTMHGASKEGVGWHSNRTFMSCYAYTAPAGTAAGAAMVQGSDGYYSCLLIRHGGYLPSGQTPTSRVRNIVPTRSRILKRR